MVGVLKLPAYNYYRHTSVLSYLSLAIVVEARENLSLADSLRLSVNAEAEST